MISVDGACLEGNKAPYTVTQQSSGDLQQDLQQDIQIASTEQPQIHIVDAGIDEKMSCIETLQNDRLVAI